MSPHSFWKLIKLTLL